MKKLIFVCLGILTYGLAYSQQAVVEGKLNYTYRFEKSYLPLKVYLVGKESVDSTVIDSTFHYRFENIPFGIYQLKVSVLRTETGFKNVSVTDIEVKDNITIPEINLEKIKMCGSATVMLGKRSEKEYYNTGELQAEGKYIRSSKYSKQNKRTFLYYKKTGIWKYYLITGELSKTCLYKNDDLKEIITYYKNGKQKEVGKYNTGCQIGDWKYYSEDGKLQYIVNLDNLEEIKISYPYLSNYMSRSLQ